MRKKPVVVSVRELTEILEQYLQAGPGLNYAVKILGHPGVGKSAVVRQVAEAQKYYFIDTRLAFKENVDLGGYPVPDVATKRMIYFRPKFIPPEEVPSGYNGILWFLDEANRAHPTVIQTLFQIITERTCGEHPLPERTAIVLAGNLGESDSTTITEFDDSALDGRLAVFQLKPSAQDWIPWAESEGLHPSVVRHITVFPERLWDESNINPNPRGWHQVSQAMKASYGIEREDSLKAYLQEHTGGTLSLIINSLVGYTGGSDFIGQVLAPRVVSTEDVLIGSTVKLSALREGSIPSEDILWALSGVISHIRNRRRAEGWDDKDTAEKEIANTLLFITNTRADMRISFFYLLLRDCGIFTQVPSVLRHIGDEEARKMILNRYEEFIMEHDN